MIPASAASPEPSAKVSSTTRSKSIPMMRAVSASCATARIARPSLVRVMTKCRSEEHTSELQSRLHLVCRLLLEKKKIDNYDFARTEVLSSPVGHITHVI